MDGNEVAWMRIIAIDLDGTLLSLDLSIHAEDIAALKQAQKQNDIISIATGRALFDVQHMMKQYDFACPIIASNGAEIRIDGKKIVEETLSSELIRALLPWLDRRQIYYQLYLPERIVVSDQGIHFLQRQLDEVLRRDPRLEAPLFWEAVQPQTCQYGLQEVANVTSAIGKEAIIKILVVSPDVGILQQVKEHLRQTQHCSLSTSAVFNLEIVAPAVDKGRALQKLCNHYGIPIQNTVAIGDSLNDVSMFQVAGISVAMENADERLLALATFKTLSHVERGVAYAFRHYLMYL
jgi:5-amino-6-(5-phospho-D-ribitylamino)uracil phosphatase